MPPFRKSQYHIGGCVVHVRARVRKNVRAAHHLRFPSCPSGGGVSERWPRPPSHSRVSTHWPEKLKAVVRPSVGHSLLFYFWFDRLRHQSTSSSSSSSSLPFWPQVRAFCRPSFRWLFVHPRICPLYFRLLSSLANQTNVFILIEELKRPPGRVSAAGSGIEGEREGEARSILVWNLLAAVAHSHSVAGKIVEKYTSSWKRE